MNHEITLLSKTNHGVFQNREMISWKHLCNYRLKRRHHLTDDVTAFTIIGLEFYNNKQTGPRDTQTC